MIRTLLACMAAVLMLPGAPGAHAGTVYQATPDQKAVIADALRAVVRIGPESEDAADAAGQGSGFVFDRRGYVLTNAHVVKAAKRVAVGFIDGRRVIGEVIGIDNRVDLAVVRIAPGAGLAALPLGPATPPEVGDPVFALGNPLGFAFSVSGGIVSGAGRSYDGGWPVDFLQHDAALNPGNSGGPLLDAAGRVVGVNTATPGETTFSIGIGLAIPVDLAAHIVDRLLREGRIARGSLGIMATIADAQTTAALGGSGQSGLLVDAVVAGGGADRAGIQPGDVVLAIDGTRLSRPRDLSRLLLESRPAQVVTVDLLRAGRAETLRVALGADDAEAGAHGHSLGFVPAAGQARDLGLHLKDADAAIEIAAVDQGSVAAEYGLRAGDRVLTIDGAAPEDARQARTLLDAALAEVVVLRVLRQGIGMRHLVLPRSIEGARRRLGEADALRSFGPL